MQLAGNTWVPTGDDYFTNYFKGSDVFEQKNLDLALSFVKNFRVAVDGGAHVGSWTRYLARKFDLVAAFEPNLNNFDCLVLNTDECNNVMLSKCGLSDQLEDVGMIGGVNSGCWSITEGEGIKLRPLPDFGALDFLKLDIEGYECKALQGAEKQLLKYRPLILIEEKDLPHKPLNYDARDYLHSLDYEEVARIGRDVIFGY